MKITLLRVCFLVLVLICEKTLANAINFPRSSAYKNHVFSKGFHIGNQAKLPLTKRSGLTSRDGWRPVIYPGIKSSNHNSRSVALNVPIFNRKIQRDAKNEFIIKPAINIIKNLPYPVQNGVYKYNFNKSTQEGDQLIEPSIINTTKTNSDSDEQNRKINNLVLETIENKNKELQMINEKLQKTLDEFIVKFNSMLENAVLNSSQRMHINHSGGGQGQSDAPPPTEAGYKGPPVLNANSTGGTLDYREEEDTEPRTQETGDFAKQSKSKRDHRYQQAVDINTTVNSIEELARNGRGVRRAVYPLGHSWPYLGSNSPDHSPPDPYVALFLSHYGRYLPSGRGLSSGYRNLYSYLASNNLHNNKPFGSYKIYEDSDG